MVTVYDIPNIEHCDVIPVGTIAHRVNTHEGWYIHFTDGDEYSMNQYKTAVVLRTDMDLSNVEIIAEADLPPDAEICGTVPNNPEII